MKKPASFQMVRTMMQPSTVSGLPSQLREPIPKPAAIWSMRPISGV